MSAVNKQTKKNKSAIRSVKYSEAEEEPMQRFILMQLPLCVEAVRQSAAGMPCMAIYGATNYIQRELPDRKAVSLKTKFNKVLKEEVKLSKNASEGPRDACSQPGLHRKGPHARVSILPLLERDFVEKPMLLMKKSYLSAQAEKKKLSGCKSIADQETRLTQDSVLGKRDLDCADNFSFGAANTPKKTSEYFNHRRPESDTEFSALLGNPHDYYDEHDQSCALLRLDQEGSSIEQITAMTFNKVVPKNDNKTTLDERHFYEPLDDHSVFSNLDNLCINGFEEYFMSETC